MKALSMTAVAAILCGYALSAFAAVETPKGLTAQERMLYMIRSHKTEKYLKQESKITTDKSRVEKVNQAVKLLNDKRQKLLTRPFYGDGTYTPTVTYSEVTNIVYADVDEAAGSPATLPPSDSPWLSTYHCKSRDEWIASMRRFTVHYEGDLNDDTIRQSKTDFDYTVLTGPWNGCFPNNGPATGCNGGQCTHEGLRITKSRWSPLQYYAADIIDFDSGSCLSTDGVNSLGTQYDWATNDDRETLYSYTYYMPSLCADFTDEESLMNEEVIYRFEKTPPPLYDDSNSGYLQLEVYLGQGCDDSKLVFNEKMILETCLDLEVDPSFPNVDYSWSMVDFMESHYYRHLMIHEDGTFTVFIRDTNDDDPHTFCEMIENHAGDDDNLGMIKDFSIYGPSSKLNTCESSTAEFSFRTTVVKGQSDDDETKLTVPEKIGVSGIVLFSFVSFGYLTLQIIMYLYPQHKHAEVPTTEMITV